LMLLLS